MVPPLGIRSEYYFNDDIPRWKRNKLKRTLIQCETKAFVHCPTINYTDSIRNQMRNRNGPFRITPSLYRQIRQGYLMPRKDAINYIATHYIKARYISNFRADYYDLLR